MLEIIVLAKSLFGYARIFYSNLSLISVLLRRFVKNFSYIILILFLLFIVGCTSNNDDDVLETASIPSQFVTPSSQYDGVTYLDYKISQIPQGRHFIFFTDTHKMSRAYSNNVCWVIQYVAKRLGGDIKIVNGGDLINKEKNAYTARTLAKTVTDEYINSFGNGNYIMVYGNHDSNLSGIAIDDIETRNACAISYEDIYKCMIRDVGGNAVFEDIDHYIESIDTISDKEKMELKYLTKMHYYVDDVQNKVRFIIINTNNAAIEYPKIINNLTSSNLHVVTQYKWFSEVLKSIPQGWDVVVCGHQMLSINLKRSSSGIPELHVMSGHDVLYKLIRARMSNACGKCSFKEKFLGEDGCFFFDFTECCKIGKMLLIAGHCHIDAISYIYTKSLDRSSLFAKYLCDGQDSVKIDLDRGDIPLVISDCDNERLHNDIKGVHIVSEVGTTDIVCFDVVTFSDDGNIYMTRFGRGKDRQIRCNE